MSEKSKYKQALSLINSSLKKIRTEVPPRKFDYEKVAEVEINEFIYRGKTVDRIMVVLRATGCSHYQSKNGCSMCAHYDGTTDRPVTSKEYISQWNNVISGKSIDKKYKSNFDINNYPILCLYNLGSFLCPSEVPREAVRKIFSSIKNCPGIKKTIIESRAEYVTSDILSTIREVHDGEVEVGIGLESSNKIIRELCHHKNMPHLTVFDNSIKKLHQFGFKALAYVNQKPIFLTEKEAIEDAINTAVYAYKAGCDAVSIEPTSLQNHSLTDHLHNLGLYRVPWLWSVTEVVKGIYKIMGKNSNIDLRIGGYFEEEVLSGSQGIAPGVNKNEIFPHQTSGNCVFCNQSSIDAIKEFNKTLDQKILTKQEKCPHCFHLWKDALSVKDSRSIPVRIIDTLG